MGKLQIGGELESIAQGNIVTRSKYIYDETKGEMQSVINQETNAELVRIDEAKQNNLTFDQTPTEESANPVTSGGVYAADAALQQAIEAILLLIPSAASALNQLADKSFVNSSVSTATATFRGTYNLVTDLGLTVSATHQQIATALVSVVSTADNNDYCFVQIPVSDQSSDIRVTERYKFDGTAWSYEYDLNNSGFTADQWAAINSGITSALVGKLGALPTVEELAVLFNGKQNVLTFDNVPTAGSNNPVKSGGLYEVFAVINAMIPTGADANNKLVAENRLVAYVTSVIEALDASYNITTGDGHVTLRLTQVNGAITSLQIATDDIASATALTALGERVSMNERDIDNLQAAYEALTQSDIVVVNGALPSSGQQQNIIYRQPDQDHTPPQFYSDYMWNGTTWVLMATYNNAIDPRPKKGSQNLVTSGGVFDNMGALDVSELNATENPHTLATYADLSAARATIPPDYRKGGMSIKFVQSSDNKYVQYRYIGTDVTTAATFTNIENWAVCGTGVYRDNPEYLYTITDRVGRIIIGLRIDGDCFFAAGVPTQIVKYVTDEINKIKAGTDGSAIDGLDKIVNFLQGFSTSETLLSYLNRTYGVYRDNPEYFETNTDSNGMILSGRRKSDGMKFENIGFLTPYSFAKELELEDLNYIVKRVVNKDIVNNGEVLFDNHTIEAGTKILLIFTTLDESFSLRFNDINGQRIEWKGIAVYGAGYTYCQWVTVPSGYVKAVADWGGASSVIIGVLDNTEANKEYTEELLNAVTGNAIKDFQSGSDYIKEYFKEEMADTIKKINGYCISPSLVLPILTDSHINIDERNQDVCYETVGNVRYLSGNCYCDAVVHLGDVISKDWYPYLIGKGLQPNDANEKIYLIIQEYLMRLSATNNNVFVADGNHDGPQAIEFDSGVWYSLIGRKLEVESKIQMPNAKPYFFVDYPKVNTRCVFTAIPDVGNVYGWTQTQLDWLINEALDVEDGTNIIIFCHMPPFQASYVQNGELSNLTSYYGICNAFNSHSAYSDAVVSCDFSGYSNSKILIEVCGHVHGEWVYASGESYNGTAIIGGVTEAHTYTNGMPCPVVLLTNTMLSNSGDGETRDGEMGLKHVPRKDKTVSQEAWDTMVYIPDQEKIHFIRFGSGQDREISL